MQCHFLLLYMSLEVLCSKHIFTYRYGKFIRIFFSRIKVPQHRYDFSSSDMFPIVSNYYTLHRVPYMRIGACNTNITLERNVVITIRN